MCKLGNLQQASKMTGYEKNIFISNKDGQTLNNQKIHIKSSCAKTILIACGKIYKCKFEIIFGNYSAVFSSVKSRAYNSGQHAHPKRLHQC